VDLLNLEYGFMPHDTVASRRGGQLNPGPSAQSRAQGCGAGALAALGGGQPALAGGGVGAIRRGGGPAGAAGHDRRDRECLVGPA
jgi:hypothetical protein